MVDLSRGSDQAQKATSCVRSDIKGPQVQTAGRAAMRRFSKCLMGANATRQVALTLVMFATLASSRTALADDAPVETPWRKVCFNNQQTQFKKVCDTRAEARKKADGSLLASVELIEREDDPKKIIRVTFPLGMQLLRGTRLLVAGIDIQTSAFIQCTAAGCMSDY